MRSRFHFLAAVSLVSLVSIASSNRADDKKGYPKMGTIERKDERFDQLIPRDAVIEKLEDGFHWSEGPVWVAKGGYLLFSDIPKNLIWKWKEGEGKSVWMTPSGYTGLKRRGGEPGSNGLTLDSEGRLVLCEHGDRRITRLEPDDVKKVLVDNFEGKKFNSPNDLVFHSNGDLYFTDPPYGLPNRFFDTARELNFCGVYRYSKDGKLTLLTKEMTAPNGIAFSPDEKTLYVANSDPLQPVWKAFVVKEDGTLGASKVFYDATPWIKEHKKGLPDGLKVDKDGNLFATGPGGVHVFTPAGEHLGTLDTGYATANVAWGDDGSVLYITADKTLCRVKTRTKGKGF
jgi:gluconolactonase